MPFSQRTTEDACLTGHWWSSLLLMSISFLVYIVVGQYFLAFEFQLLRYTVTVMAHFQGGSTLPSTLILTTVGLGYDSQFYRTVMLEERRSDYTS